MSRSHSFSARLFWRHPANGLGTGLTTLRERLQLIFGDAAHLRLIAGAPRGLVAEIDMPAHT